MPRLIPLFFLLLFLHGPLLADVQDLLTAKPPETLPGLQIEAISARFLGTPYQDNTLGGGPDQPESLTVDLEAVDCFTLLDYVEAVRRASTPEQFRDRLGEVRYFNADISWSSRKHFFTNWSDGRYIDDVTAQVGQKAVVTISKILNRKSDGTSYLESVATRPRRLDYIPAKELNARILSELKTGDYLGIYSDRKGLDVSHVGILIKRDRRVFLRHASSRPELRKVIDSPLLDYLQDKPGIIVLRARPL